MPGWRDLMSGALADPEIMGGWKRSLKRLPTTLLGGPVDLANAAIGGLDYLGGGKGNLHASEKPVGGSQWLAEQVNKGIPSYPTKPGSANADMLYSLLMGPVGAAAGRGVGNTVDAIAAAKPTPIAGSPAAQAGVLTYHGTPHNVPRYDLSKIGTGEGAQVYGHGMYFAEEPAVARQYRNALSHTEKRVGGEPYDSSRADHLAAMYHDMFTPRGRSKEDIIDMLRMEGGTPAHLAAADIIRSGTPKKLERQLTGGVYQQELPDEMLPRMLQWDKPLSEQPEHVQKIAKTLGLHPDDFDITKGGALYNKAGDYFGPTLSKGRGFDVAAAEGLHSLGIPGVSYFDQGSRAAGQGSRNHVVWDQQLLDRMVPLLMK